MITSRHPQRASIPLWAWPTALSLDAPLVAICWQWFFAKNFGVELSWLEPALLFLTVWLIYAADRLLDGLKLDLTKAHTFRHAFYIYNRQRVLSIWGIVFLVVATLALFHLKPPLLYLGFITLSLTALYGASIHYIKPFISLTKELQVGFIFALGTSLVIWMQTQSFSLLMVSLGFALLCSFNCLLISKWESNIDKDQDVLSLIRTLPVLKRILPFSLGAFTLLLLLGALLDSSALYLALALASFGLLSLSLNRSLPVEFKRVLADFVLLTPLIWLI